MLNNYRPLSLQSILYKIPASHVAHKIQIVSDKLGLMSQAQAASRKEGRTGDHIVSLTNTMAHAHASNSELHIILTDIAKAYDTAPREALLEALEIHGFPSEIIRQVRLLQTCQGAKVRTRTGTRPAKFTRNEAVNKAVPSAR
jgi:hypothetical protein